MFSSEFFRELDVLVSLGFGRSLLDPAGMLTGGTDAFALMIGAGGWTGSAAKWTERRRFTDTRAPATGIPPGGPSARN